MSSMSSADPGGTICSSVMMRTYISSAVTLLTYHNHLTFSLSYLRVFIEQQYQHGLERIRSCWIIVQQ